MPARRSLVKTLFVVYRPLLVVVYSHMVGGMGRGEVQKASCHMSLLLSAPSDLVPPKGPVCK